MVSTPVLAFSCNLWDILVFRQLLFSEAFVLKHRTSCWLYSTKWNFCTSCGWQYHVWCLLWFFMILPTAQPKNIKETSKSKSYPLHLPSVVEVVLVSTHLSVQPHNEGNPGLFEHPGSTGSWNHQIRKCLKNVFFHIFTDLIVIYADDSWSSGLWLTISSLFQIGIT